MTRAHLVMAAALLLPGVVACGSEKSTGDKMTVRGTVAQSLSTAEGARAVAVGADGRTIWTYLDSRGDFTLKLPVGQSYRVLIANPRASGGQQTAGYLVLRSGAATTRWIGANQATTVDLGRLTPAPSTTAASTGVRAQSATADLGTESDHDDDNECKEDDREHESDDKSDVCTDDKSTVDLEPSKQPGEECKDDRDHKSGHAEGDDDDDDGDDEHGDDHDDDAKLGDRHDHEKPCSSEPAPSAPAPGPAPSTSSPL